MMRDAELDISKRGRALSSGRAGIISAASRWVRVHVPLAVVIAIVALGLTGTIAAWAVEVLTQTPSYDWYTDDPAAAEFEIASAGDLRGLAELVNGTADIDDDGTAEPAVSFEGKTLVQTRKIGLASQEFTPIGTPEHPFAGTYDGGYDAAEGAGMDIRTLQITQGSEYVGLFGYCSAESTLKNIYISDVAGAGFEPANVTLSDESTDLVANSSVESDYHVIHDVGSIVGYTAGSIEGCESRAAVSVSSNRTATNDEPLVIAEVGGIAGTCLGTIANSAYHADLTVEAPSLASDTSDAVVANVGGVVGTLGAYDDASRTTTAGTISGCHFGFSDDSGDFGIGTLQATIQVTTTGVGGLDRFGVEKEACSTCVGGIAGYSYGSITDCINYGLVNANSTPVKLYKDSRSLVHIVKADDTRPASYPLAEDTFAMANGANGVGGIVGSLRGSGIGTGAVSRASSIGTEETPITLSMCFNTGTVVGLANVGGIAGRTGAYAAIDSCRNGKPDTANGTGTSDDSGHIVSTRWNKPMTGGIAGVAGASVTNCANLSEVENIQTGYYTAGIVGSLGSTTGSTSECAACFNAGSVHVTSHATQSYREAGIVGNNGGYVHDCVMRSGSVLAHDDDEATYPNAAIGDDSWGAWSNIKFFKTSELKKSDAAAVLNTSHAGDVLPYVHGDAGTDGWVYWYIATNGYPTLSTWDAPAADKQTQLTSANTKASCVRLAEYAGDVEAIPELIVTYTNAKGEQTTLVQNVDFYALPQKGATEMTGNSANQRPYQASIIGIGNYAGMVENVCNYGIGPCDLANCEVSTSSATYNFGACVYPDEVYVTNPAGKLVDASEYSYVVYSDKTFLLYKNVSKNYIVYDSEGFVSWDGGTTRQTVASQHDKLAGDLSGVDYILYDAGGNEIFKVTEGGTKQATIDPDMGTEVDATGPNYNKSKGSGVYAGAQAGFVVKVSAKDTAATLKEGTSTTGQFVVNPIDIYTDCAIDKVEVTVPSEDASSTETKTWQWDRDTSTLYELDARGKPMTNADGSLKQASVDFTGAEIRPTAQISYTKDDGTVIVVPQHRTEGWYPVYGDPNTAEADLDYLNRDATPLIAKDGIAEDDLVQANKDAGLAKHEKAALTARTVLRRCYSNYVSMYFTINPVTLDQCSVVVAGSQPIDSDEGILATYAYRGGYGVCPTVTITRCGNELVQDRDYTVEYENNVEPTTDEAIEAYLIDGDTSGLASYTIKGAGNISTSSSQTGYFIIAPGKSLAEEGYRIAQIDDQQYNFEHEVQPKGGVKLLDAAGKESNLVEGTDYEVVYKDNTKVNTTANVYVYGINGYTGMLASSFNIVPFDMNDEANAYRIGDLYFLNVSNNAKWAADEIPAGAVPYTAAHRDVRFVKNWKTGEISSEDEYFPASQRCIILTNKSTGEVYEYDQDNPASDVELRLVPAGEYACTLVYGYTCTGSETFDITVVKSNLADQSNVRCEAQTYDGTAKEPRVLGITGAGEKIITYADNVNAGTAKFYVTAAPGNEYCTGTYVGTFVINKVNLADADVSVRNQLYTGAAIEPEVKATCGDYTLVPETDFTVEYINNTRKGTATVILTGQGNCEGTATATFTIGSNLDISQADIAPVPNQLYAGAAIEPKPVISYEGALLEEGKDYSLAYSDNTELSTDKKPATVTVTGLGIFANSTAAVNFAIVEKRNIGDASCEMADQTYTGSAITPAVTARYGDDALIEGVDFEVAYRRNVKAGSQAFALLTGKGVYEGSLKVPFNIVVKSGTMMRFGEEASDAAEFAVAAARETNPAGADSAMLVWQRDYAAQVAASTLAAVRNTPVLLTNADSLPTATWEYLQETGVENVTVVDLPGEISPEVESELAQMGISTTRVEAEDPSTLALELAASQQNALNTSKRNGSAVVAHPANTEEAALAASYAAANGCPFYFTNEDGLLTEAAETALAKFKKVVIVGDEVEVDVALEGALAGDVELVRLQEGGLCELSASMAAYTYEHGVSADETIVASLSQLKNELAAIALCAKKGVPLVFVSDGNVEAIRAVKEASYPALGLTLLGNSDVISDEAQSQIREVMGWR